MNKRTINISSIQDFFDLILSERCASYEELHNFLHDCVKFVFDYHNLNINNYEIQLHPIKTNHKDDFTAIMEPDYSHPNKFDVFINKDLLTFKELSEDSLNLLFTLMFTAFHEFGHIIQYLTHPRYLEKTEKREYDVVVNITKHIEKSNKLIQNKLIDQYNKHEIAMEKISSLERNADYQAISLCKTLFLSMYEQEDNEIAKSFYMFAIKKFNRIRKNRYILYRKADKQNKQAIKALIQNGIKKEDLFNK